MCVYIEEEKKLRIDMNEDWGLTIFVVCCLDAFKVFQLISMRIVGDYLSYHNLYDEML